MNQDYLKNNKTNQVVASSGSFSVKRWPKYLVWLVPLVVVAIVIIVVVVLMSRNSNGDNDNISDAESSLLTKAATAINNRDYDQLGTITDKITKQSDYEKDPNYLYVLAAYHIDINDPSVAENYLQQLDKVYGSSVGYAEPLQQVTKMIPAKQLMKQAKSMQTSKGQSVHANVLGDSSGPKK